MNGSAATTSGLLYQDGWSLLDDTTSAIFDDATKKVTPRPGHGGQPYQDGYVFGYGHDYSRGLTDLATLTGPSELLPRWAYGVWYSEYYNHTAADYENTILPAFRANGTPLDVLVTDTDFKSPSTWDGWEMNPSEFPDPKAFFDWSAAQGLHNALNIHPSIASNDPQFAQAQATAGGGLTLNSGDYVFDWGNPAQLKAYFGLHQGFQQAGADIKSGGILATRTGNVTNDEQNPLTRVTVTVAGGAAGSFGLYEDSGSTTNLHQSAVTWISYSEAGAGHTARIAAADGSFAGQVSQRQWTVSFLDATTPTAVAINGQAAPASAWKWDASTHALIVTAPAQSVHRPLTVSYR